MNELSRREISELKKAMVASMVNIWGMLFGFEMLRWFWLGFFAFMFCLFFFFDFWHFEQVYEFYLILKRKLVNENPGKELPPAWEILYSALPKSYIENVIRSVCTCIFWIYIPLALYWFWKNHEIFLLLSFAAAVFAIDRCLALRYAGTFKKKYLHVKKKPKKRKVSS